MFLYFFNVDNRKLKLLMWLMFLCVCIGQHCCNKHNMFKIQSKITRLTKKQKNVMHAHQRRQLIEINSKMTYMLGVADKNSKAAIVLFIYACNIELVCVAPEYPQSLGLQSCCV